jgi:hypothetical protein
LLESLQRIEAQLHAILDAYHPAPAQLFSSIDRNITLAFIADYPTPQAAARIGEQRMAAFCRRQSYRGRADPAILTQRLKDHLLSGAEGTVAGKAHSGQAFAELLGLLNRQLADYDDALDPRPRQAPECADLPQLSRGGAAHRGDPARRDRRGPRPLPGGRGAAGRGRAGPGHPVQRPLPPRGLPLRRQQPAERSLHVVGLQLAEDLAVGARRLRRRPSPQAAPSPRAAGLGARWMRVLWRAWTDGVPYDQARHLKTDAAREVLTAKPTGATAAA